MRRLALFAALLLSFEAGAATGSAAADTFYVRPASACANNGDGMAYACAASAGASGAWRTSAAVSYSTTTGVDDGDTLKFCGDFVEADLDTGAYFIFLSSAVTAASEAGRITISGDCSAEGGASIATVTGNGGAMKIGFGMSVSDYITIQHFDFSTLDQAIANTCQPASSPEGVIARGIRGNVSGSGAGMSVNGNPYLLEDIDITAVGEPILICPGAAGESNGIIRNARLVSTSTTDIDADGIQQSAGGGAIRLENIDVYKRNPFKGCGIVGSVSGAVQVDGFRCHWLGAPGAAVSGLAVDGSGPGGYVRGWWSDAPGVGVLLRDDVTPFAGAFEVSGGICAGCSSAVSLDGVHPAGAISIFGNSGWTTSTGILAESGYNPLSTVVRNNIFDAPVGIDVNATVAAADIDIDFTRWGESVTSWKWRGTTDTSLDAYKVTSSKGANDTQGDPVFIGGPNPTTAEGFKPGADSPLCGAGTPVSGTHDYNGRRFVNLPAIGAFACQGGHPRTALTPRTTFEARTPVARDTLEARP